MGFRGKDEHASIVVDPFEAERVDVKVGCVVEYAACGEVGDGWAVEEDGVWAESGVCCVA